MNRYCKRMLPSMERAIIAEENSYFPVNLLYFHKNDILTAISTPTALFFNGEACAGLPVFPVPSDLPACFLNCLKILLLGLDIASFMSFKPWEPIQSFSAAPPFSEELPKIGVPTEKPISSSPIIKVPYPSPILSSGSETPGDVSAISG